MSTSSEKLARSLQILMRVGCRQPGQKITRAELAEACGCSEKSIDRTIGAMREAGIPLDHSRKTGTYSLPKEGWTFPLIQLSPVDAVALALVRSLLTAPGVPYANAVRQVLDKVAAGIPPPLLSQVEAQAALVRTSGKARDYSRARVSDLVTAAVRREQVEIDYDSRQSGGRAWRRIDPYGLEEREGYLELHAWCHRNQAVRTFALDRIHDLRWLEARFEVREAEWMAFTEEQGIMRGLRGGEAVDVVVVFSPEVAPYAQDRRWPSTLRTFPQPDGTVWLIGTVRGVEGILVELLGWRRHCRVLGGEVLRRRIEDEITAMYGNYFSAKSEQGTPRCP